MEDPLGAPLAELAGRSPVVAALTAEGLALAATLPVGPMIAWELAGSIGRTVASAGGPGAGTAPLPGDLAALGVRAQEAVVAYTGLVPQAPLPVPEDASRGAWVDSNIGLLRGMIDPAHGDGRGADRAAARAGPRGRGRGGRRRDRRADGLHGPPRARASTRSR